MDIFIFVQKHDFGTLLRCPDPPKGGQNVVFGGPGHTLSHVFSVMHIFQKSLFRSSENITFKSSGVCWFLGMSWFFHFFPKVDCGGVHSSPFSNLARSGELPNRPWPCKSEPLASTRARFSKNHVFYMKNHDYGKTKVFFEFGPQFFTQNRPKSNVLASFKSRLFRVCFLSSPI